jgi:hypothetical protein
MRAVEDVRVRHITYMTRSGQKVAGALRAYTCLVSDFPHPPA